MLLQRGSACSFNLLFEFVLLQGSASDGVAKGGNHSSFEVSSYSVASV